MDRQDDGCSRISAISSSGAASRGHHAARHARPPAAAAVADARPPARCARCRLRTATSSSARSAGCSFAGAPSPGGLLITSHRRGRLPTLIACTTSVDCWRASSTDGPRPGRRRASAAEAVRPPRGQTCATPLRDLYDVYADPDRTCAMPAIVQLPGLDDLGAGDLLQTTSPRDPGRTRRRRRRRGRGQRPRRSASSCPGSRRRTRSSAEAVAARPTRSGPRAHWRDATR